LSNEDWWESWLRRLRLPFYTSGVTDADELFKERSRGSSASYPRELPTLQSHVLGLGLYEVHWLAAADKGSCSGF
jgi:hypothetical protein